MAVVDFSIMILTIHSDMIPIPGEIKVNLRNSFRYFSMKTDLIRKIYTKYINKLNKNIQSKGLTGKMYLCRFENHDGNILLKVYLKHLYS